MPEGVDLKRAERVCLFSHYDPCGHVGDHVCFHLQAIRRAGFCIAFISAGRLTDEGEVKARAICDAVWVRENVGLDFGNWRFALKRLGELDAERLLLTNDSVYGPFAPLPDFLQRLEGRPADIWGAIESSAFGRHLQSWFLLLTQKAHRSPAFRELLREPIEPTLSKWALVQRYEIGLSRAWLDAGLHLEAAYVAEAHGSLARIHPFNPCGVLWRELVEGPVPYVKTSMLRTNRVLAPGIGRWSEFCSRLEPHLASLVAADLVARDARPPTSLSARFVASCDRSAPQDWPEVQEVLRRNHRRLPGSCRDRLDRLAFAAVVTLGGRLRSWIRGIRRRLDAGRFTT